MIGYYNYTVVLTYIGTIFGFIGIMFIWTGSVMQSLICLMIAGFCDMFDGKVAFTKERTKKERRFGIQIDSLSDLICFGVLPASIIFNTIEGTAFKYMISALFLLCALIRLAWFNVEEEERHDSESDKRTNYIGLPVTSCALILPLFISVCDITEFLSQEIMAVVFLSVAIAFIMPFRIKKAGTAGNCVMIALGVIALITILWGI